MNLVIDFFNVYIRVSSFEGAIVYNFFKYIYYMQKKFKTSKVYYAIDGDCYCKKEINENYKKNKSHKRDSISDVIRNIIPKLPNQNLLINPMLEADDIAYCFCRDKNHCTCISDDRDWLLNISANTDIKLYKSKVVVHRDNFQHLYGYPIEKIELKMFLDGDAKDGIKKPFRLKGKLLENVNKYESIKDYIKMNGLDLEKLKEYISLIAPVTDWDYKIIEGKKVKETKDIIRKYRLNFLKESILERELHA